MNRSRVGLLSLLLVTGLGACDDSTGPGDSLTQAEAEAVAQVLLTQAFTAGGPTSAEAPTGTTPVARQVVDFNNEFAVELPCPLGGFFTADVTTSGTVDSESGAANLQYTSTQSHSECRFQPAEAGNALTLNGSPSITSTFQFSSTETGDFETSGSLVGSVNWNSGDRSGTCVVSLEFSGSGDAQGGLSFSMNGGVCSAQISQQVSVTA